MKNILYIGNNLSTAKTNVSSIQTLGKLLEGEGYSLRYASHYTNKVLRLLHICWASVINFRWANAVLIDTYSTQNFYFVLCCSQICRLLKVPYFHILHGGNLPIRLKNSPKLCHLIFTHSQQNITPSLYLKSEFEAKGFLNVMYIPNSISIKNYEVTPKKYDAIRLLWVRSFSEIYNPKMAVHVLKKITNFGYKTALCMVGPDADGSLNKVKELAKDLNVEVIFTGKLSKKEWIKISDDYNIFLNTTNFDNAPVSVIEAMALGFPIVSTNVGGLPYLLEDKTDALLVNKNDVDTMAQYSIELFKNRAAREILTKNARKKAESFDWNTVKNKWNHIFKTI